VQEEAEEAIKTLQADISKIQTEMSELKTVLYAKFGNSINLEA
jgi:chaperonin cofactor prefoldin